MMSNAGTFRSYARVNNAMVLASMPWTVRDVSPVRETPKRAEPVVVVKVVNGVRIVKVVR